MNTTLNRAAPYAPAYGSPLEHAITRGIIDALGAANFVPVAVWDNEAYIHANGIKSPHRAPITTPPAAMTIAEVLDAVFAVSPSATVHFAPADNLTQWGAHGIHLSQGNGRYLISDFHPDKDFARAVLSFIDLVCALCREVPKAEADEHLTKQLTLSHLLGKSQPREDWIVVGTDRASGQELYVTEDGVLSERRTDAAECTEHAARSMARAPDLTQRRRVDSLTARKA
jgi:hypothetical protein